MSTLLRVRAPRPVAGATAVIGIISVIAVCALALVAFAPAVADAQAAICTTTCCCPRLAVVPELHSTLDQLQGEGTPNFTASYFTGRRQLVLPSRGLVTLMVEIHASRQHHHQRGATSNTNINNCSWATAVGDAGRCPIDVCIGQWMNNDISWALLSEEGQVPDLLSTGGRSVSPTVQANTAAAFEAFTKRMRQSAAVTIGAVYVAAPSCDAAVSGLRCHRSRFWYLPRSGRAWLPDIAVALGQRASRVVERMLPPCAALLAKLESGAAATTGAPATVDENSTAALLEGLQPGSYDASVALSREDRILCSHPSEERNSSQRVVTVVPIVRSKSDVTFQNDALLRACINNHYQAQPDACVVAFVAESECGYYAVRISKKYGAFLDVCAYLGLAVAVVSSLALP